MTETLDALFIWQKSKYRMDEQEGINCAVFRNESLIESSLLITEAVQVAYRRWGYQRLFTFVDPNKIKSVNPGYCFKQATPKWTKCGESASGLVVLELLPPITEGE